MNHFNTVEHPQSPLKIGMLNSDSAVTLKEIDKSQKSEFPQEPITITNVKNKTGSSWAEEKPFLDNRTITEEACSEDKDLTSRSV